VYIGGEQRKKQGRREEGMRLLSMYAKPCDNAPSARAIRGKGGLFLSDRMSQFTLVKEIDGPEIEKKTKKEGKKPMLRGRGGQRAIEGR